MGRGDLLRSRDFWGSLNLTEICAKVSILSDPCLNLSSYFYECHVNTDCPDTHTYIHSYVYV